MKTEQEAPRLERLYLPSRIRRGRLSTVPTWRVTLANGETFDFQTRKDAGAFVAGMVAFNGEPRT